MGVLMFFYVPANGAEKQLIWKRYFPKGPDWREAAELEAMEGDRYPAAASLASLRPRAR